MKVWTSKNGYNHQSVGRKVSQIQAVLARRCSAIGELQEHILKAGWQRGVAQWGVLGQGGQWAPVAGFDGTMDSPEYNPRDGAAVGHPVQSIPPPEPLYRRFSTDIGMQYDPPPPSESLRDTNHSSPTRVMTNVLVQRRDGGGIFVEDPSNLADWSVQAIGLVRRQLLRAANGQLELPFLENWLNDQFEDEEGPILISQPEEYNMRDLPRWAAKNVEPPSPFYAGGLGSEETGEPSALRNGASPETKITNLPLMVDEVSELLNIMEDVMEIQRERRLEKLRPPTWFRRNWYIVATVLPSSLLLVTEVVRKGQTKALLQTAIHTVTSFVKEHLVDPVVAM